ncbi:MAG: hypothetical protein RJQ14_08870 [Marinoscillum sp.]|uniref:hypothetical protein n=1 Tax=Gimesia maris TaxID=122 RepID=UPI0032EFC662
MPATPQNNEPSISEIYAAFDADSHQIFRAAMSFSRGGVVRVNDLLAALMASEYIPSDLIPGSWHNRSLAQNDDFWVTPMSNEPALRELLTKAYRLAAEATEQQPQITASILFAAGLLQVPAYPRPLRAAVSQDSRGSTHCTRKPASEDAETAQPVLSPQEKASIIDECFTEWASRY